MPKVVAEVVVDGKQVFIRDTSDVRDAVEGIGEGAEQSSQRMGGLTQAMTALGGALATREVAEFARSTINAASDLEQSVGAIESVFGDAAARIAEFGATADQAFGLSRREVNETGAVLGAMLQSLGFDAVGAADQVILLQQRAADMAATFGGPTREALEAIAALMRGERDPIERYGVSIKQADVNARILADGLDTSTTQAQRMAEATAALDLLMEQTGSTAGQFAREADTAAGAEARLAAQWENAKARLGDELLPVWTSAVEVASSMLGVVSSLPGPVQAAGLALGGLAAAAPAIHSVVTAVRGLSSAAGGLRSLLTGPWGLAIAGATTAIGFLASRHDNAAVAADAYTAALDRQTGALAANATEALAGRLQQEGLLDLADELGVSYGLVIDAIVGGRDAMADLTLAVVENDAELRRWRDSGDLAAGQMLDMLLAQQPLLEAVREEQEVFAASAEQLRQLREATGLTTGAMDAAAAAADAQTVSNYGLVAAHHVSLTAAIRHAEHQRQLAIDTALATERFTEQQNTLRAAADPYFAAAQAQERLADAQDRLEQAETAAEVAAAQDEVARAALDLQGALVDLEAAQVDGETSADDFAEALGVVEEQGFITAEVLDALIDRYNDLADAADRARIALMPDNLYGTVATDPGRNVPEGVDTRAAAPVEPATRSGTVSVASRTATVSVGDVHLHGVDPSRPGEARRLSEEFLNAVADGIGDLLYEAGGRP